MTDQGEDVVRLADRLSGRTVLLTGVTGFVGEALLHRLLTQVPGVRVVVLVRPRGPASGVERVASLLSKRIFSGVVGAAGGVDALVAGRLQVIEGDLVDPPELPRDVDAVVHCAGDVSFDPPVDEAFATNVVGTRNLLRRVAELGSNVHYVHISTAYVAGRRRGVAVEGPVEHDVDLEAELAWSTAQRRAVEHRSRDPHTLAPMRAKAEREHGRAGMLHASAAIEERRRDWIKEQLVTAGRERARSLGWTDAYTFSKALGERLVEAHAESAPVSIVRPSIVESALTTPKPGWIEGFKMAEPIILAFGRGELPEFPGSADSTADIVPVDQVVAAVVAVLAHPPAPGSPRWYHVSSGARNPLSLGRLYSIVRDYFDRHPFATGDRGAVRLPEWRFRGSQAVERLLVGSERAQKAAQLLVTHAPRADRTREMARKLERQRRRLEFLRHYIDLYREYADTDASFADANTVELFRRMHPQDQIDFNFDTSVIDWDHYLGEVHCPAVTAPLRMMDAARSIRRGVSRSSARLAVDGSRGDGVIAVFDMDGTLLSSNVIESYLWLRLQRLDNAERLAEIGRVAMKLPGLVWAERRDRSAFLRTVYREYAGARLDDLNHIVDQVLTSHVLSRLSPAAVRRVRQHRAAGHSTVLITGAIRPLTRPLAPLFDHIEAAELAVDQRGVCTGFLERAPLVGESRAAWLRHWARERDVDMAASFAYADSHSDLPLLSAVGHPVAVRPDITLFGHAKKQRWPIEDWASAAGAGRPLAPTGDRG